jgi:hypothetical protein
MMRERRQKGGLNTERRKGGRMYERGDREWRGGRSTSMGTTEETNALISFDGTLS